MFRRIFEVIKKWVHSRTKTVKKEVNAMSILICEINGNVVPMAVGSMRAATAINNRGTASFVVYEQNAVTIQEGMNVVISRSDTLSVIFSGKIESVRDVFSLSENLHTLHINAVGWERIADRRIVAEVYRNRTAGYIVADIVAKYFAADGITVGVIEDGDMIPAATFAYRPAADVLRSLSEANDFVWFIDHSKALHFQPRSFSSAPWQIDTIADPAGVNSAGVREVSKYRALEQYRNRQYLKYSEISAERTESFGGDGLTRTWNVELPIAQAPAVAVNGFAQTVGISGIDTGKDFYWNKGSAAITADAGNGIATDVINRNKTTDSVTALIDGNWNYVNEAVYTTQYLFIFGSSTGSLTVSDTVISYFIRGGGQLEYVGTYNIYDMYSVRVRRGVQISGEYLLCTSEGVPERFVLFLITGGSIERVSLVISGAPLTYSTIINSGSNRGDLIAMANGDLVFSVWQFSAENREISHVASINWGLVYTGSRFAQVAWNGDYVAINTGCAIRLLKLNSDNTISDIAHIADNTSLMNGTINTGLSVAWRGNTLYASAVNVNPNQIANTGIRRFDLDPSLDTLTYVDSYFSGTDERGRDMAIIGQLMITRSSVVIINDDGSLRIADNMPYAPVDFDNGYITKASTTTGQQYVSVLSDTGNPLVPSRRKDNVHVSVISPPDISVTYRGTYPNVLLSDDPSEQASRAIIEGGTGIYAAYQNAPDAEGEPSAIDIAQTILERYGRVPERFEFTCTRDGLQAGQILPVNWPDMGIAEDYLIESVQATETGGTVIWYRIKAISGRDVGNWQEFWRSLRETDSYDFGGGDTLPVSRSVRDVITEAWTDSAVTDVVAAQTQWDLATFDIDEWQ